MCGVAADLTGVVEKVVLRGDLSPLVHGCGPVGQIRWVSDEVTSNDHRVGMERGTKQVPGEAVHAPAEPCQTVEDVLPVEQQIQLRPAVSGHGLPTRSEVRSAPP